MRCLAVQHVPSLAACAQSALLTYVCIYIHTDTLVPSKPSSSSHKTCQGVQNRSIPASQSFSVLRYKEYSCKGPLLPCDGVSLCLDHCEMYHEVKSEVTHPSPHKNHVPRLQLHTQTAAEPGLEHLTFALRTTGSFLFILWSEVKSTDTSFPKCLLLVKSYFCWQLRAFDLSEQQVLSRRKFVSRLASSLPHKDHFFVKNG